MAEGEEAHTEAEEAERREGERDVEAEEAAAVVGSRAPEADTLFASEAT